MFKHMVLKMHFFLKCILKMGRCYQWEKVSVLLGKDQQDKPLRKM